MQDEGRIAAHHDATVADGFQHLSSGLVWQTVVHGLLQGLGQCGLRRAGQDRERTKRSKPLGVTTSSSNWEISRELKR